MADEVADLKKELKDLRIKYYTHIIEDLLDFAKEHPEDFNYFIAPMLREGISKWLGASTHHHQSVTTETAVVV